MRFKNILLCRVAYTGSLGNVTMPPVGLAYLSQALVKAGIEHSICDLALFSQRHEKKILLKELEQKKPDALGISMMTRGYRQHYNLLNTIKTYFPQIPIIVGGSHLSTFREKMLLDCQAIDYGIVKEGEESLVALCQGEPEDKIQGLYYRKNGAIQWTEGDNCIADLDTVAFPKYEKFSLDGYEKDVPLVTSRGCPFACTFCSVATSIGRRFRVRSPESIMEEIYWWHDKGYRRYAIWDDNFTMIRTRVLDLCDLIEKSGLTDLYFSIPNGVRADRIDKELLQRMWEIGFRQLSFGVESGVDHVLKNVKKAESAAQIEQAIKFATEIGYEVYLYFIIGLPGERYEDFLVSKRLAEKYQVAESRFYNLVPFPGTELYEWAKNKNYLLKDPDIYLNQDFHHENNPNIVTPEMSIAERKQAFKAGLKLMHRQRRAFRIQQYKRLGIIGYMLAIITVSDWYRKLFKPVWARNYVIKPIKYYIRRYNEGT
jgi:anaerobic magnesium-protoporphyrin IX monomethyl ester cyclase